MQSYVVMHQGETFEIEAKVVPDTADNNNGIIDNNIPVENVSSSMGTENYPEVIEVSTYKIVTEDMLRYYYEKKKNFTVIGEKYKIYIDASDIVNCDNELNTQIDFMQTPDGIVFEIKIYYWWFMYLSNWHCDIHNSKKRNTGFGKMSCRGYKYI